MVCISYTLYIPALIVECVYDIVIHICNISILDNANDEQKNGQFMGGTIRVRDSGLLVS